ncbi:hypothetical protein BU25DRAFT_462455 [Macroventuria anomochaeta]|uniref:Uncharacterized protein n=1 Tax=Macroventuria anomochaeta TaxID=301207 RepID=A0ACB6RPF7_9PLEO|nr:uncharacterized protein BU25DRAFT_462455 [Macroventuria anomochaeta]KAF2622822.1 hypothetical protein BU25DRAFT_462455 [Macroventuria anomochaeta]
MAGGRCTLWSATNNAEGQSTRKTTGQEPGDHCNNAGQDGTPPAEATTPTHSSQMTGDSGVTPSGQPAHMTLPLQQRRQESQEPIAGDLQATVQQLLNALNHTKLSGAPASKIEIQQRQFNRAVQAVQRTQGGLVPGSRQPAFDEAGRIIQVLNNVQLKPKLGMETCRGL